MIRVIAFAALALLLCGIRHAQAATSTPALWLSPGGHSVHFEPGHNDHNPGLLLELAWSERWSAIGGVLRNSQARRSHLVAMTFTPGQAEVAPGVVVKAGFMAGLIDGYRYRDGRPFPMAGLHAEVGTERVRFAATALPPVPGTSSGAVFLTVKVRLP